MQCRSCGTDNREGRKFCSQCASTLSSEILCPACGAANEPGDKFCGECARALAVAIQQTLTAHNSENPGEPIRVRIGLHTGEAIKEGEDLFGKTVILGARIAS